jgi:hypothetical protein
MENNHIVRKQFIEAAGALWEPIMKLTHAWEKLTTEDNGTTAEKYPFNGSFDDWAYQYAGWFDHIAEKFVIQTEDFSPTITVKELKAILNTISEDTQVVVRDDKNDWWLNITEVELPDEDNGCFTITFNTQNNFDTRQF